MKQRRRELTEPLLSVLLDLEHAQALLRPWADDQRSPLPSRMRHRIALVVARLSALRRDVARDPQGLTAARDQELGIQHQPPEEEEDERAQDG